MTCPACTRPFTSVRIPTPITWAGEEYELWCLTCVNAERHAVDYPALSVDEARALREFVGLS